MPKAQLIGNVGTDPDMKYSANGAPFLRFNVASNFRARTPEGQWEERTEWVRVTVFGQRAESLAQHLKKGMRVYVDGRLEAKPWTEREGGVRAGLELMASDVEFMSSRQDDDQDGGRPAAGRMPQATAVHGARAGARTGAAVVDRDDDALDELPF